MDALLKEMEALPRRPDHIAVIMDGNGRWAQKRGLPRTDGHREGAESVRAVTRMCRRLGVQTLTLYAFSEQNWSRPKDEVDALLSLLLNYLESEREELKRSDIRLVAVGNVGRMPLPVRMAIRAAEAATAGHRSMTLALCLSYGGREEIVEAARKLADRVERGDLRPKQIDEATFEQSLWTASLSGPPDLVIRTSGEQRVSNFLLWQAAYAEYFFSPLDWPDFRDPALADALRAYAQRERRFGGIGRPA